MIRFLSVLTISLLLPAIGTATVVTRDVTYQHGDTTLKGYLAYDDEAEARRPGVLIIHQWTGLSDYEKKRARMLAEMGYVAFAADVYGEGIRPSSGQEAGEVSSKYKGDRELWRERLNAGLDQLRQHELSDPGRLAAIGYCFGGTGVIELARSGADIEGVVSFHGGLDSPTPEDGANIKASVLALHGAADPTIPDEELNAFQEEMETHEVDWYMVTYGHAKHSFTEKDAGSGESGPTGYNEKADKRSWREMKVFFDEVLQ